jgi:uncharacterized membrane protein
MNAAHVHLLINHVPILGVLFGLAILIAGRARRSADLVRAGLTMFVAAGLGAGVAYLSGQRAEEVVESLAGVSETLIEAHEESALLSLIGAGGLGLLSLIGLIRHRGAGTVANWLVTGALVLALVTTGSIAWTANLGGQIRHSEIRSGTASAADEEAERPDQQESSETEENKR